MKTTGKIALKITLIFVFLYITPFYSGIQMMLNGENFLNAFVYHQKTFDDSISIKDQLNLLAYNQNLTIDDEFIFQTTQDTKPKDEAEKPNKPPVEEPPATPIEPPIAPPVEDTGKKVYIYNTHQNEAYAQGETVMDAAAILGNALEAKGIHVVLETANFEAYANTQGWDYNDLYGVSNKYLNDALVNYGGFDLIIDLHRDAIPREASYFEVDGISYAKLMSVVGGLSRNASTATSNASTLNDIMNAKCNGIMRSTMIREAYYNQQVSDKIMLIECGGDVNPFEEIKNSMGVLADGIHDYLMR